MTKLNLYSKEQIDALDIGKSTDAASATGSLWARIKNALSRIGTNETNITALQTGKADDNAVVKLTGDQTISNTKTFNSSPIIPTTPASPTSAINSAYVNDATDGVNNLVHKSGNERITGIKSFQSGSGFNQVKLITTRRTGNLGGYVIYRTEYHEPDESHTEEWTTEEFNSNYLSEEQANFRASRLLVYKSGNTEGARIESVYDKDNNVGYCRATYRTPVMNDSNYNYDVITIGMLKELKNSGWFNE